MRATRRKRDVFEPAEPGEHLNAGQRDPIIAMAFRRQMVVGRPVHSDGPVGIILPQRDRIAIKETKGQVMIGSSRLLLEVAIASADDACVAQHNGADRLELCTALSLGGLTPSLGSIEEVRYASSLPLMVLIRPRPAGFCYREAEFTTMCRDAELALRAGADGIVFGILTDEGKVDRARCDKMRKLADARATVFHRAFDVVPDPFEALEQIIDLGFQRILTSGQEESALRGSSVIRDLINRSNGRIEILPGAGINADTVRAIVRSTGCRQVHGSMRSWMGDSSTSHQPYLRFGGSPEKGDELFGVTDGEAVRAVRAILDELAECDGSDG